MAVLGDRGKFKDVAGSLVAISVAVLLFQRFATGHRLLDILLFQMGFRILALGVIIWWMAGLLRDRQWGRVVGLMGGCAFIFGVWSGVRLLLEWVDPLSAQSIVYGLDIRSWWAGSFLAVCHVILIGGGLLLILYARSRATGSRRPTRSGKA